MVTQNSYWNCEGSVIDTIECFPEGTVGFIYELINNKEGWRYIGKKSLYSHRTLPPLKNTKRKRKVTKPSDWLSYYSSNKVIKEYVKINGTSDIQRNILHMCSTKKLLTYYENKYLYCRAVLEPGSVYLNDNISGKLFKGDWKSE